jgi:hypothetical protein
MVHPGTRGRCQTVIRYWRQFARSGNPNAEGLPNWPRAEGLDQPGQYFVCISQAIPASAFVIVSIPIGQPASSIPPRREAACCFAQQTLPKSIQRQHVGDGYRNRLERRRPDSSPHKPKDGFRRLPDIWCRSWLTRQRKGGPLSRLRLQFGETQVVLSDVRNISRRNQIRRGFYLPDEPRSLARGYHHPDCAKSESAKSLRCPGV